VDCSLFHGLGSCVATGRHRAQCRLARANTRMLRRCRITRATPARISRIHRRRSRHPSDPPHSALQKRCQSAASRRWPGPRPSAFSAIERDYLRSSRLASCRSRRTMSSSTITAAPLSSPGLPKLERRGALTCSPKRRRSALPFGPAALDDAPRERTRPPLTRSRRVHLPTKVAVGSGLPALTASAALRRAVRASSVSKSGIERS
jgi:hypothetical protein